MTVNLPEASRIRVDVWYIKPTVYALYIYSNLSNDTWPRTQIFPLPTFIPSRRKDESDFADCYVHSRTATANADSHG